MPEKVVPGPVLDNTSVREAVCIHTKKIFDSCKDKDCIEDLRFYPTESSKCAIDRAICLKAGKAELLNVYIDVEPISFNRGFYTVDVRYFYKVTADAFVGAARPVEVCGLCVFDKRIILFGSEGTAKVFTSASCGDCDDEQGTRHDSLPCAVVEALIYTQRLDPLKILKNKNAPPITTKQRSESSALCFLYLYALRGVNNKI